jgi:hypothetical protein
MLKDLVEAFTGQYKFKMDIASVRSSLRAIKKKGNNDFIQEYA